MGVRCAVLFVSVVTVATPVGVQAQSADRIIERYIDAIGGKRAVERIASTAVSGSVTSADGRAGVFTQQTHRPNLLVTSMSWDTTAWQTGFNGRAAWQDDERDGLRTLNGPPAARVRAEATWAAARHLLADKVSRVSLEGGDEVRGRPVTVLLAVMPDGTSRRLFFDADSLSSREWPSRLQDGRPERPGAERERAPQ